MDSTCLRMQLPGVVAFIGPNDVPKGGHNQVFDDLLFAEGRVHYVGQKLGLIVATSQVRAHCSMHLEYSPIVSGALRMPPRPGRLGLASTHTWYLAERHRSDAHNLV